MASCKEFNELISLYIDNELDEAARSEFEEHARSCDCCKEEFDDIMQTVNYCREIPEEEPPEDFKQKLHSKLVKCKAEEESKNKLLTIRNRYIKICSSIAAGLMLVFLLRGFWGSNFIVGQSGDFSSTQSIEHKEEPSGKWDTKAYRDQSVLEKGDIMSNSSPSDKEKSEAAESNKADTYSVQNETVKNKSSESRVVTAQDASKGERNNGTETVTIQGTEEKFIMNFSEATSEQVNNADTSSSVAMAASPKLAGLAVASVNTSSITILSDKPWEESDNIKKLVGSYGGNIDEMVIATTFDERVDGADTYNKTPAEPVVLTARIPNDQYEKFLEALKVSYTPELLSVGEMQKVDNSAKINELTKRLEEVNNKINSEKNTINLKELNELKVEKEKITADIENLKKVMEYTEIQLTIGSK
ncbi:MAG: zf-HC2 domain-containing protein [Clostridia bacterium]|nr:zf-HC2 domain-containing protein [Clostridia bacterium]